MTSKSPTMHDREKRRYLEWHHGSWRVVVTVPRILHGVLGTKLKHPLHTDSLRVANHLKGPHVRAFKDQIAHALRGTKRNPLVEEALAMEEALRLAPGERDRSDLNDELVARAEAIRGRPTGEQFAGHDAPPDPTYDPDRERQADEYVKLARGETAPLDLHHAAYLKSQTVKARTAADDARAIKFLAAWCVKNGIPATVQEISKRRADAFLGDLPELAGGISPTTVKKYLNRLSRYWQWLETREYASENVWRNLRVKTPPMMDHEREREFTRDEMVALLSGPATPQMHDLMRIAALTGARLDAIVDLKAGDCADGAFRFKPQKKETAYRIVPIHSALRKLVARRVKGALADANLFPEWPPPMKDGSKRERSFKASNAFTDYRRSVGVDATVPGKRRALTNFHSFRRWFITEAERAGISETIIAAVVGHKRKGMTLGVYSGGPGMDQLAACVEAVKLPRRSANSAAPLPDKA